MGSLLLTTVGVVVGAALAAKPNAAGACSCPDNPNYEVRELTLVSVETNATDVWPSWSDTAEVYFDGALVLHTATDRYELTREVVQ